MLGLTVIAGYVRHDFPYKGYVVAVLLVAAATLLRIVLFALFGTPFIFAFHFPAILLAALYFGASAGFLALGLTIVTSSIPAIGLYFGSYVAIPVASSVAFVLSSLLVVWLAAKYRNNMKLMEANDNERQLLMKELEHRGKNKLAVIQSIITFSLADQDVARSVSSRIESAVTTEELLGMHPETTLHKVVCRPFAAFGEHRVKASGPEVFIRPHIARALSMIFHEMTTNAVKHGALSKDDGVVNVTWTREGDDVTVTWTERDGPPVYPPEKHNFGSKLITTMLKGLGGGVEADFQPLGLVVTMHFKIT